MNETWNVSFPLLGFYAARGKKEGSDYAEGEWEVFDHLCREEYGAGPDREVLELFTASGHPHSVFVADCPDGFQYADVGEMIEENPDLYHSFGVVARFGGGDVRFVNIDRYYDVLESHVYPSGERLEIAMTTDAEEIVGLIRLALGGGKSPWD